MSSRFNLLYHGSASDAADMLDGENPPRDVDDLRAALTNALRRIATLERHLARPDPLSQALNEGDGSYRP